MAKELGRKSAGSIWPLPARDIKQPRMPAPAFPLPNASIVLPSSIRRTARMWIIPAIRSGIGKLDAAPDAPTNAGANAYCHAMAQVIAGFRRVLKNRRYMALCASATVSNKGKPFMPISFELFALLTAKFISNPSTSYPSSATTAPSNFGYWHTALHQATSFLRGV